VGPLALEHQVGIGGAGRWLSKTDRGIDFDTTECWTGGFVLSYHYTTTGTVETAVYGSESRCFR
jgi:hypothetical protein